jgi:branched-chain amino acid transport system substrate-binding protein
LAANKTGPRRPCLSPKDKIGTIIYNRGVYNSMLIVEAIRTAQKITGKALVNGEDVRRGLESLDIDAARLKELGMEGFTGPIRITCADHNGHRPTFMQEWDGTKYVKVSDWLEPLREMVMPLLEADAKAYAEKNAPWPKRSEQCDPKS